MIYHILSIIIFTLIFVCLYKAGVIKVCPICAGVVITWVLGMYGILTHAAWANPLITAILLGASLGAIADKHGSKFGIIWKSSLVVLGLPAIYFLVQNELWKSLALLAVLCAITLVKYKPGSPGKNSSHDLFKNCC